MLIHGFSVLCERQKLPARSACAEAARMLGGDSRASWRAARGRPAEPPLLPGATTSASSPRPHSPLRREPVALSSPRRPCVLRLLLLEASVQPRQAVQEPPGGHPKEGRGGSLPGRGGSFPGGEGAAVGSGWGGGPAFSHPLGGCGGRHGLHARKRVTRIPVFCLLPPLARGQGEAWGWSPCRSHLQAGALEPRAGEGFCFGVQVPRLGLVLGGGDGSPPPGGEPQLRLSPQ